MTKNKKKLRRAERKYSVSRTAQTLVLTGLLLAGGVGSALAATEINDGTSWNASAASGDITYTGESGKEAAVSTTGANTADTLGTLTITGSDTAAALTAAHDLKFMGAVSITGASGNLGSLIINTDKTFTSDAKTTVGDYGKLEIKGTHVGLLEATGADSAAIEVTGTQKGDVTLNGAGASLTAKDDAAEVWGKVTVTEGTLSTASNDLKIVGTDGKGLGTVILGADSTLTLGTTKTLTLGTLTVNKDTDVEGKLTFESLTGTNKLTLNTGGEITVTGAGVTLNSTGDTGLLLGTGGDLTVDNKLTVNGTSIVSANGTEDSSATDIKAGSLHLGADTTLGAADKGAHTMTITATADTPFLSGANLTLVGAADNETTLNLNGVGTSEKNITLAGTVAGDATLNVGASSQAAPTKITINTLTVGGTAPAGTEGKVAIIGNGTDKRSILTVSNLIFGALGKVDIGAHGVLNIDNDYTIADDKIGSSSVAGGIQVGANSAMHVKGTLTLTDAGGGDVSAGVDATGTLVANVFKAGTAGDKKLTWTGGSLTLLGDGSDNFLQASELEITGNGVNLGMVNDAPDIQGGSFGNKVTVATNSKLHVNKGEWTLNNATDGLNVGAANGVEVVGGTLNVAKWDSSTTSAGTATVQGGTLNLTGTAADSIKTDASDITASKGGVVTANAAAVLKADWTSGLNTGVGKFAVTDTGVLKISTDAKDMDIATYNTLKGKIMTGTGTLRLDGVTIKGVTESTKLTTVDGVSVANNVVVVDTGDTVANFGTEVKGLKGAGTANVTLTVSGGLTIVGDSNTDFKLSDNGNNATNITVSAANSQLNLGSAVSTAPTNGTLNGNVTLSNAAANLNATNGTFTVRDVIATTGNDGVIKADRATLTTGKLGTSTAAIGSVTAQNGIVKTTEDAFVTTVNLKNGVMQANNMTVGTANVDDGKLIADNKLTITNAMDATKVTILAKELDAAAAITAANSSINVDKMTLKAAVSLTEDTIMNVGEFTGAGSAQTVTVGATTDTAGSSLTIGKLTSGSGVTTFYVDPNADNSIVQVKSVADAGTSDKFIAANNGIVSFGQHGMDWAKAQMAASGMAPTAALVLATPTKLTAAGQILVGKSFNNTGQWTGDASPSTHALDVRGNSLIIADVSGLGSNAALDISTATAKTARIDSTAGIRLYSNSLKGDQSYTLVSGLANVAGDGLIQDENTVANGGSLSLASKSTSNMLVGLGDVVYAEGTGTNGTLTASTYVKNASDVLPRLSSSMGSYLENMARTTGFDATSDNAGIRFVSRALDDHFIGTNDPTQAAATIEGAAQLAVVGAAPAMTISAATAGTSAATTRTSFATPLMDSTKAVALHQSADGSLSLDSGVSAGDSMKTGLGVWIMPLYQSNNVWGMKSGDFKGGYTSDLGGVALGADYTIDDSLRFGLAFNLGGGYAQSKGDFNSTDNSFNFWGINLYGGWTQNNFGLSGDVGYTSTYNKMKQELPSAMQMGDIKSDVTSRAWTAGLRGEYKFATEALDIIPHVGVRYLGLTTDDYKAKSNGDTVFKADESFQNIWTFPVGLTFTKEMTNSSGWSFRPQLDLGVTPAAGDVKAKSRVRIPGVDGSAEMKMQVMDYISYDGGVGLEMKKDNVSFGVNYNIQASEHRTGHGVFGTFRYEF